MNFKVNRIKKVYRGCGTILVETDIKFPDLSELEEPALTAVSEFCENIISLGFEYAQSELYNIAKSSLEKEKNRFRFRGFVYSIDIGAQELSAKYIKLSAEIRLSRSGNILFSRSAEYIFDIETGLIIPPKRNLLKNKI